MDLLGQRATDANQSILWKSTTYRSSIVWTRNNDNFVISLQDFEIFQISDFYKIVIVVRDRVVEFATLLLVVSTFSGVMKPLQDLSTVQILYFIIL